MKNIIILPLSFILISCQTIQAITMIYTGIEGQYYFSPDIHKSFTSELTPFEKPIARDVKIFYFTENYLTDFPKTVYQYTDEDTNDANGNLILPAATIGENDNRSKVFYSNTLSKRAKDSSARGSYKSAELLHKSSIANLKMEQSFANAQAAAGLLGASASLLEATMNANITNEALALTSFLKNDINVIGSGAPKNTVLHIYYTKTSVMEDLSPVAFNQTDNIVLSLNNKDGKVVHSIGVFKYFLMEEKINAYDKEISTPPDYFVPLNGVNEANLATEEKLRKVQVFSLLKSLYKDSE